MLAPPFISCVSELIYLTSLSLCFILYKMKITTVPNFGDRWDPVEFYTKPKAEGLVHSGRHPMHVPCLPGLLSHIYNQGPGGGTGSMGLDPSLIAGFWISHFVQHLGASVFISLKLVSSCLGPFV